MTKKNTTFSEETCLFSKSDNINPSEVVSLDCEMVGISNNQDALGRCSIVDYFGNVLYDKYVKPESTITDYRTKWSGIKPHHMHQAISFKKARGEIYNIIKNKVIVGHSLHFDFKVLKLNRNNFKIRDISTSTLLRQLANFPSNQIVSLKRLAQVILGRDIQSGSHCSIEDSIATMDLYKIVENDWGNNVKSSTLKYLDDFFWPCWLQ